MGGYGVPEILAKKRGGRGGDESASALKRTARCGHTVVIIGEVMGVVMCLVEMCNLEENK